MEAKEMVELCLKHTLFSWSATGKVDPIPVARAEGVCLYSPDGKKWLDFNSQLMSVNIGHGHPHVVKAIQKQAETLCYADPSMATEIRAKLGKRLAELVPGDINTFFFTLGGAEANENAIKAARLFTGRHKIMVRYRSYHGATHGVMSLTGDPRRWPNEPGMAGIVRVMDPWPYDYSFGKNDEEIVAQQPPLPRRGHPVRRPGQDRRDVHRDGHRHERHPAAAEGLPRRVSRRSSRSTASCSSATR